MNQPSATEFSEPQNENTFVVTVPPGAVTMKISSKIIRDPVQGSPNLFVSARHLSGNGPVGPWGRPKMVSAIIGERLSLAEGTLKLADLGMQPGQTYQLALAVEDFQLYVECSKIHSTTVEFP